MSEERKSKSLMEMTDEDLVEAISQRYRGRLDTLDLSVGTTARSQLALDLGLLIGLAMRLLAVRLVANGGRKPELPT